MKQVITALAGQTVDIYTSHSTTLGATLATPSIDAFGLVQYTFLLDGTTVTARTSICEVVAIRIPDNVSITLPQPTTQTMCSCCEKTWRDYFNSFSLPTSQRFIVYIPTTNTANDIQKANIVQVGLGTVEVDGKIGGTGSTNRFILSTCQLEKVVDTGA
jgi:hypothetical protein